MSGNRAGEKQKKLCIKRKSMFFTIDALLASAIIVTAVLLANSQYTFEYPNDDVIYSSTDIIRLFDAVKVKDVDNIYVKDLISNGTISGLNDTLIVQMGKFQKKGNKDHASKIAGNITSKILPASYSYSLKIDGEVISQRNLSSPKILAASSILISWIDGQDLYGPYLAEVEVWH